MKSKRVGRGYGSGKGGHTVGSGTKGQKSRSGYKGKVGFEGGNVPLYRRLPKFRGFRNPTSVKYEVINFSDLETHFENGDVVSMKTLKDKGLIKKRAAHIKILAKGTLSKKLKFEGVVMSEAALSATRQLTSKAGSTAKKLAK